VTRSRVDPIVHSGEAGSPRLRVAIAAPRQGNWREKSPAFRRPSIQVAREKLNGATWLQRNEVTLARRRRGALRGTPVLLPAQQACTHPIAQLRGVRG
jgi:hypothetical protein